MWTFSYRANNRTHNRRERRGRLECPDSNVPGKWFRHSFHLFGFKFLVNILLMVVTPFSFVGFRRTSFCTVYIMVSPYSIVGGPKILFKWLACVSICSDAYDKQTRKRFLWSIETPLRYIPASYTDNRKRFESFCPATKMINNNQEH